MKKITFNQIIEQAKTLTADGFDKFLSENRIKNTTLDMDNIFDLNEGYYNVYLDDQEVTILFCDGEYDSYSTAD